MTTSATTTDLIKASWASLTGTDRKVARALLSCYPVAGLQTLAELAEQAGVSAPSIIRFVKKLGFKGYPAYQKDLHAEIGRMLAAPASGDSAPEHWHLPERVHAQRTALASAIERTFSLLQEAELVGAARLLADPARRLSIAGGRDSYPLAHVLHRRLRTMRPNCELLSSDPLERSERLIEAGRRDVIVVVDGMPFDPDLAAFARLASERGAQIVLFTDDELSAVAEVASFVFIAAAAGQYLSGGAVMVCVIDVVLDEIQRVLGKAAGERLRRLQEVRIG